MILVGTLAIVALFMGTLGDDDSPVQIVGFLAGLVLIIVLTAVSLTGLSIRGKAVTLDEMPHSLRQGTIYTVVGMADGHAVITDGQQNKFQNYGEERLKMWLINLAQTNVVVGKKYVIINNPKSVHGHKKDSRIFIETDL